MPVEILEAAAVHKAVINFRSGIGLAASGDCLRHNCIDAFATLDRETQHRLDLAVRIDDSLGAELGEVRVAQKIMNTMVSDHTIAEAAPGLLKRASLVKPLAS
jgi:hypothetical protein